MTEQERQRKKEEKRQAKEAKRKARAERKRLRDAELDTETTFADMNVEGFSWYNPHLKKQREQKVDVSRKEYWAMVWGMLRSMLPLIGCILAAAILVFMIALVWLQ
ncbi:MAG: hypothetical protein IJ308_00940 [Clostridia bacterium]|nr:hypothetical protein [Clostridia bacterium]